MRILVVLHDLPLGGTERVALRLAKAWTDLGHQVTLLCGSASGAQAALVPDGVKLVECVPEIPRGLGSRIRLGRAVAGHLRRHSADVLFVPGNFHWSVCRAVARSLGADRPAIVAQVSSPLFKHGREGFRQWWFERGAQSRLRDADALVALSPKTLSDVDAVFGRRLAAAIPLPALDDEIAPAHAASGKLIVAAGRLAPEKGYDIALRAFANIRDPEARLVFVGDGPLRGDLESLAQSLGLGHRVTFAGYAPDIRPWLDRARLLLLSSWHEGFGAVIVEALGRGRPVVATACTPAVEDLLKTPTFGRVAAQGDVLGLAKALDAQLGAPPPDPALLVDAVQPYRISPVAARYIQLFQDARAARSLAYEQPQKIGRRADLRWFRPKNATL